MNMKEGLAIFGFAIAAAVAYGIVHDQITARVCIEYFTVFHPPISWLSRRTTSPTLIGVYWGIVATWWVGAILGVLLALTSRLGSRPKLRLIDLYKPIAVLLIAMAICALFAGVVGYSLARFANLAALEAHMISLPDERKPRFFADRFAHNASYAAGGLGGLAVCAWAWRLRGRRRLARS